MADDPQENVSFSGPNAALGHGFLDHLLTNMASPPSLAGGPPGHLQDTMSQMRQEETLASQQVPTTQSVDDEAFGTLVVDDIGRSRYLGPRAGTEWLQNVSHTGLREAHGYYECSPHLKKSAVAYFQL